MALIAPMIASKMLLESSAKMRLNCGINSGWESSRGRNENKASQRIYSERAAWRG